MSVTSKASQLFDAVDQREFLLCRSINQLLRYRPIRHYFSVVSRLGDGCVIPGDDPVGFEAIDPTLDRRAGKTDRRPDLGER